MKRTLTAYSLFGVAVTAMFLATKLLVVLATMHWVTSAMLGLALAPQLVLAGIMAIPTLFLLWKIGKLCYQAETSPENN